MNIPKNIFTKEEFIEILEDFKTSRKFEDDVYNVFNKYMCESPSFVTCEFALVNTLNKMFNQIPSDYGTDIEYFIYDLNFGKDYKPGCLTYHDEEIDISTAEKLYDWLIRIGFGKDNDKEDA